MTNYNGVFPPCRDYHDIDNEQANRNDLTIEFLFGLRKSLGDDEFKQYLAGELA